MLKVTLAIASLLNQADARADEWTTTGNIITDSWMGGLDRENYPSSYEWDYISDTEYDTDEKKYGAINWMKICRGTTPYGNNNNGYYNYHFKIEWTYQNMCDYSSFSEKHCVGDCTEQLIKCTEISVLNDGECINNLSFYATQSGVDAIRFETTDGTEDVLIDPYLATNQFPEASWTLSSFENSQYTEWQVPMTNSTTTSAEKLVCLTALEPEMYLSCNSCIPANFNYRVSYNPDTPLYNGTECEEYRNPEVEVITYSGGSAGGVVGSILGICCCGGIGLAVWFFFFRRTGSAGSLNADNQKPSTPEAAPQQTTTTTIIQQQPAMMMQPQPMMMQQQPMMMQQPGPPIPMMPMQQPGMMPMQQPGMMPMQPMQQPGMMPMQPMQQPGMGQPYNPYAA